MPPVIHRIATEAGGEGLFLFLFARVAGIDIALVDPHAFFEDVGVNAHIGTVDRFAVIIATDFGEVVEDDFLFLLVELESHLDITAIFEDDAGGFLAISIDEDIAAELDATLIAGHNVDDFVLAVVVDRGIAEHKVAIAIANANLGHLIVDAAVPSGFGDVALNGRDIRDALSEDVGYGKGAVEAEGVELGGVVLVLKRDVP